MAVGKNKRLSKRGAKGAKSRSDPFQRKEWYSIVAPNTFVNREVGKTIVTKTTGTKIASDGLKGRVFEASLADLNKNEDDAYRKIQLKSEEVEGTKVLTTFYGMDLVRHKIGSLIRKFQTLIEAHVDVKTTDGYTLRLFCIGFTKKRPDAVKKTAYASSKQVKRIRAKMVEIMVDNASKSDLRELVLKFIPEKIGKEIEKQCQTIYPLQNCFVRKVKLLSSPKFDLTRLLEAHAATADDVGAKVDRANPAVPQKQLVTGSGGRL